LAFVSQDKVIEFGTVSSVGSDQSEPPFEGRRTQLIQLREPGLSNVLHCLDVPVPEPKPDEVLLAHAIGMGLPDVLIRAGTYSFMSSLPATPSQELAGMVEKIGVAVTTRRPGQRVYASAGEGRPLCGFHRVRHVLARWHKSEGFAHARGATSARNG
jgi:NADPH:quinone reductase-like Zn-dependent oxidoreductase